MAVGCSLHVTLRLGVIHAMEGRYHALAKERIILLRYESLAAILGWWRRRQKTLERPAFIAHPRRLQQKRRRGKVSRRSDRPQCELGRLKPSAP
jgi:hypothetical protein